MSLSHTPCILCDHPALFNVTPPDFVGVTSDCKPWPRSGQLCICRHCGHVQKLQTPQWLEDVARIYDAYEMYPLSVLSEQMIRIDEGFVSRNGRLASRLAGEGLFKPSGTILDLGCGNGGFLQAFSREFPAWRLYGCEQQACRREDIMKLPAAEGFFLGGVDAVDRTFDCISLVYVIEHLFHPRATLAAVRERLAPGGHVFIKTANLRTSPFDLAVTDHCHHFTLEMLVCLVEMVGLRVVRTFSDWVDKEMGCIAVLCDPLPASSLPPVPPDEVEALLRANLEMMAAMHRQAAENAVQPLGVLGTAISATWLVNQLGEGRVSFFVDEDESKVGKTHMGLPVLRLADAPARCALSIPFPPHVAGKILQRIRCVRPDIALLA